MPQGWPLASVGWMGNEDGRDHQYPSLHSLTIVARPFSETQHFFPGLPRRADLRVRETFLLQSNCSWSDDRRESEGFLATTVATRNVPPFVDPILTIY